MAMQRSVGVVGVRIVKMNHTAVKKAKATESFQMCVLVFVCDEDADIWTS